MRTPGNLKQNRKKRVRQILKIQHLLLVQTPHPFFRRSKKKKKEFTVIEFGASMSSAGYVTSGVIFFLGSAGAALGTHYHYCRRSYKSINVTTHVMIVISIFVCLLPFPLLVLDLDAALTQNGGLNWMKDLWLFIMLTTQVMAWAVLPICQEYDSAGEFTPERAFKRSVKENLKMYVILGVVVGALFAYIVFLKGLSSFSQILSLGIAAANAFGLFLIVIFLASGLVGVPRMLYRSADPEALLRTYYYNAQDIQEDLDLAAMDLAEIKAELAILDPRVSDDDRPHLATMLEALSDADRDIPLYHTASSRLRLTNFKPSDAADVTTEHLEMLNAKLKRAIKVATRMNYMWDSTLRHCKELDQIINGVAETNNPVTRVWITFRRPIYLVLSFCAFILTVLVLWSELVLPFQSKSAAPLSVVTIVVQSPFHFLGSVAFLFYMAACSYWATFQFKVFEVYHVLPSVSDATSLCFIATFLTRLLMPMCYNFLNIAGQTGTGSYVEYSILFGSMDVVDILGSWFNKFIPVFIPLVAVLIVVKVFDKLLLLFGVERHSPDELDNEKVLQQIQAGRRLVVAATGREMREVTPRASAAHHHQGHVTPPVGTPTEPKKGQRYAEYLAKKKAAEPGDAA